MRNTIRDETRTIRRSAGRDIGRIFFDGLEELVPAEFNGRLLHAWLSAPIAGEPLFLRLFEPFLGVPIRGCFAAPGRVANALAELTEERPCFGHVLRIVEGLSPSAPRFAKVPGHGIFERIRFQGDAPRILPTGDFESLMNLATIALEGDLRDRGARGEFRDNCLVGERARLHPATEIRGVTALGADSCVAARVTLGHQSIIGERCHIGEGSILGNCLVLDGSIVPPGSRLFDTLWPHPPGA